MANKYESRSGSTEAVIQELKKIIEGLAYGTITIKVHNGRVTQLEITEKRRIGEPLEFEKGGGI